MLGWGGGIDLGFHIPAATTLSTPGMAGDLARLISGGGHIGGCQSDGRAIGDFYDGPLLPNGQRHPLVRWPNAGALAGLGVHGGGAQPAGFLSAGQVDVVYNITKGGMRCSAPGCTKLLVPATAHPRDDLPIFARIEHRIHHCGMRGAPNSSNIRTGFICSLCSQQARA